MMEAEKQTCHGCIHLRYRPSHLENPEDIVPAWCAPGYFLCDKFELAQPATLTPIPLAHGCKDAS